MKNAGRSERTRSEGKNQGGKREKGTKEILPKTLERTNQEAQPAIPA